MSESQTATKEAMSIGLLGASFDTGNMGVNALAESTIKCILHRWPDAKITLLDSGIGVGEHRIEINDKDIYIKKLPIRFCKNIFLKNHFLVLCFYAILFKVFHGERFKHFCSRCNTSLKSIIQMNIIADITGGDSFSDIYGMRRFTLGFLRKWLVLMFNKDLIMLPQTYGPFRRFSAKAMARYILKRASSVYSRDKASIDYITTLLNNHTNGKVRFSPDVAFVLDARKPEHFEISPSDITRNGDSIIIGLNVSGLLFNVGYDKNNMFGLKADYPALINSIIDFFMKNENTIVLLVPHVFSPKGTVESDPDVCQKVFEAYRDKHADRIFVVSGKYDQAEIKYIIGRCDFFIGARMHSCIAALSQCIPAVGIAYSKKFHGVFDSIDLSDCVIDIRNCNNSQTLEKIGLLLERRNVIRKHLEDTIPQVKNHVLNIFELLPQQRKN